MTLLQAYVLIVLPLIGTGGCALYLAWPIFRRWSKARVDGHTRSLKEEGMTPSNLPRLRVAND